MTTPSSTARSRRTQWSVAAALAVAVALVAVARMNRKVAPRESGGPPAVKAPAMLPAPLAGLGTVRGRLLPAGLKGDVLIVAGTRLVGGSGIAPDGTFLIPDLPPGPHRLNYRLEWEGKLWLVEVHDEGVPDGRPLPATRDGVEAALKSIQGAFAGRDAATLLANYSDKFEDGLGTPIAVVRSFHTESLSGAGPMKDLSREAWLMDVAGTDDHPVASVKLRFRFQSSDGDAVERTNDFLVHFAREGAAWKVTGERKLWTGSMNVLGPQVETRVFVTQNAGVVEVKAGEILELPELDFAPLIDAKKL
ncbi:MAG: hypothetical protein AAB074_13665 [Planctomycetota bacterium]